MSGIMKNCAKSPEKRVVWNLGSLVLVGRGDVCLVDTCWDLSPLCPLSLIWGLSSFPSSEHRFSSISP